MCAQIRSMIGFSVISVMIYYGLDPAGSSQRDQIEYSDAYCNARIESDVTCRLRGDHIDNLVKNVLCDMPDRCVKVRTLG